MRATLSSCSAGTTIAFHPAGSDCADRTPPSSACVASGTMWRWPTSEANVSLVIATVNVSVPLGADRRSSSVTRERMRPEISAEPEIARMRKAGDAETRFFDLTAAPGRVSVIVSGDCTSYSGKAGSVRSTSSSAVRVTISVDSAPRTMLFQPPSADDVATSDASIAAVSAHGSSHSVSSGSSHGSHAIPILSTKASPVSVTLSV